MFRWRERKVYFTRSTLVIFEQKNLAVVHADLFFEQVRPQNKNFQRSYQFFSRTSGLQHKSLILIESPNTFH